MSGRGSGRDRRGNAQRSSKAEVDSSEALLLSSRFGPTFAEHRSELDTLNFTRENIYKIARDVTMHSKRIIGHLQRIRPGETYVAHLAAAREEIRTLNTTFMYDLYTALSPELAKHQDSLLFNAVQQLVTLTPPPAPPALTLYWPCLQKFSFSLEEYVEALSFYYYLQLGSLMPPEWLQQLLTEDLQHAHRSRLAAALAHAPLASLQSPRDERRVNDSRARQAAEPPGCSMADEAEQPCDAADTVVEESMTAEVDVAQSGTDCTVKCDCGLLETVLRSLPVPTLPVNPREVLLGYFDLTGEVMRFVVSNASAPSHHDPAEDVARAGARFMSLLSCQLQLLCQRHARTLGMRDRDVEMKVRAMLGSVDKVERICYQWTTRSAEYGEEELQRVMAMMARERGTEEAETEE